MAKACSVMLIVHAVEVGHPVAEATQFIVSMVFKSSAVASKFASDSKQVVGDDTMAARIAQELFVATRGRFFRPVRVSNVQLVTRAQGCVIDGDAVLGQTKVPRISIGGSCLGEKTARSEGGGRFVDMWTTVSVRGGRPVVVEFVAKFKSLSHIDCSRDTRKYQPWLHQAVKNMVLSYFPMCPRRALFGPVRGGFASTVHSGSAGPVFVNVGRRALPKSVKLAASP